MKRFTLFALSAALAGGTIFSLLGCESSGDQKMSMTSASGEKQIMCQSCYDEVKTVPRPTGKGTRYQVIRKHMCSECKVDTSLYTENGVQMFKCARCAPDGIACDKCRPPKR